MCDKCKEVLDLVFDYGGIDGGHHKQWLLDQVVKKVADDYDRWVESFREGEDGPNTYEWDTGIAP